MRFSCHHQPMTAPTDTTGDVVLVATHILDAAAWALPEHGAEARLALEEQLVAQARGRGRELRDARHLELVHLKRHTWTDQETGRPAEWLERVEPREADLVELVASAAAYRP